jgi:hypothetical protein
MPFFVIKILPNMVVLGFELVLQNIVNLVI